MSDTADRAFDKGLMHPQRRTRAPSQSADARSVLPDRLADGPGRCEGRLRHLANTLQEEAQPRFPVTRVPDVVEEVVVGAPVALEVQAKRRGGSQPWRRRKKDSRRLLSLASSLERTNEKFRPFAFLRIPPRKNVFLSETPSIRPHHPPTRPPHGSRASDLSSPAIMNSSTTLTGRAAAMAAVCRAWRPSASRSTAATVPTPSPQTMRKRRGG